MTIRSIAAHLDTGRGCACAKDGHLICVLSSSHVLECTLPGLRDIWSSGSNVARRKGTPRRAGSPHPPTGLPPTLLACEPFLPTEPRQCTSLVEGRARKHHQRSSDWVGGRFSTTIEPVRSHLGLAPARETVCWDCLIGLLGMNGGGRMVRGFPFLQARYTQRDR